MARNASKAICTLLVLRFYCWVCLGIRHSDSVAQMLLDQSRRASCDRGRLHDSEMKFLSNAYTNPNTNPKTLTAGILTLNAHQGPSIKYVTLEGEGVRESVTVCDRGGG